MRDYTPDGSVKIDDNGTLSFNNRIASLYPGKIVTLIRVDGSSFGANVYCFHNENIKYTQAEFDALRRGEDVPEKTITWQGEEYGARPFGISGISFNSDGKAGKPTISLSNVDQRVAALVEAYSGMKGAKVEIFIIAADDYESIAGSQYRRLVYYIERCSWHDKYLCQFECSSPFDLDGLYCPGRVLTPCCSWASRGWYRSGKGCDYSGNKYFNKNNDPVSDPALDVCAGTVTACKLRFGENGELPFGGAAVASLDKRLQ